MDIQPIKVLMVEDSDIVILAQTMLLETYNFNVDVAETGYKGIEKANTSKYQLIIIDIGLPDIDGIEVAKQIQRIGKNTTTPIIAITAQHDSKKAEDCLNAGALRVFKKPLVLSTCKQIREFICTEANIAEAI